ncbi:CHAT domain-containing protein [Amycolatopsis tolypomycina]|uniref:CHAT domain-containing protein n=1 Tax=Amycolatopsis tolypomycina TaxID=208445 RepID=A0A1H4WG25_9PSEU|nr:CHAT domain-containing protein [Amycolatopsis tolypomycina]SEC92299.1 CHAT domain-containing protein [Amycolatopsis tolypomycina]
MIHAEITSGGLHAGEDANIVVHLRNDGPKPCTNIHFALRLPAQIPALRGNKEFAVPRLDAGTEWTTTVKVRPLRPGSWTATSANFSFRDDVGGGHRITDFQAVLDVAPPVELPPAEPPRFEIELSTVRVACGEWDAVKGEIVNTGAAAITWGRLSLQGPFSVDPKGTAVSLGHLPPGERESFEFHILARETGRAVPVHLTAVCANGAGGPVERKVRRTVAVGHLGQQQPGTVEVLYLAANPTDTERISWDAELRDVEDTLRMGRHRDRFVLRQRGALRVRDLTQALLDFSPRIVHLSGHGTEDGQFLAEAAGGEGQVLSVPGLAALFEEVSDTVECVIVNACHSARLAEALAEHISYVIGMRSWLGDRSATDFSVGFYQALVAGLPIEPAFKRARAAMALGDERLHGRHVPVLYHGQ